ncbi:hypothetical protein [Actinophytocola sp.]|uniref:hypothetical protein n=1 Tax=Actinophytocola sp. TaxID=1872138 RepID=UPI002D7ECBCF|nr:hypothetical protein [Actinophytocola sp.]HET9144118.1 hypothetical protein [Actinophytocola sp.]
MTELRKAVEVFKALERHRQSGYSGWVWYSPGDSTRYRAHLIQATPVHADGPMEQVPMTRILLVQVIHDPVNPKSVLVHEPSEWSKFTPEMWVNLGHPMGWWAAVRPLLAALGWTDEDYSSVEFNRSDADDMDYLLRRQNRRQPARIR